MDSEKRYRPRHLPVTESGKHAVLGSFHRSMALDIAERLNTGGRVSLSIVKVDQLPIFAAAFSPKAPEARIQ